MINEKVVHSSFGTGVIIRVEKNIAVVNFTGNNIRDIVVPDSFEKGYLKFADSNKQEEYFNELIKYKKKEREANKDSEYRKK